MATNYKNTNYFLVTGKQTLPVQVNGTGTIVTDGTTVIGTGTLFTSEMQKGSWLVDLSTNEIRKVINVTNDTLAYIDYPFTVDLAGIAAQYIPIKDLGVVTISVDVPAGSATAGEIDGVSFPAGNTITFSKDSRDHSGRRDLIDPIIVNGSGTTMLALITR